MPSASSDPSNAQRRDISPPASPKSPKEPPVTASGREIDLDKDCREVGLNLIANFAARLLDPGLDSPDLKPVIPKEYGMPYRRDTADKLLDISGELTLHPDAPLKVEFANLLRALCRGNESDPAVARLIDALK